MEVRSATCRFCERYGSEAISAADPWDSPLLTTDQFVVVPTKGALVPGWALVIPHAHELSFAALRHGIGNEIDEVLKSTEHALTAAYGPCTVFEHGAAVPGTTFGCGVDHAHLHIAPLGFSLLDVTTALDPEMRWHTGDSPWRSDSVGAYLALREPDGVWMTALPKRIPSQFFRRAIATALGAAEIFGYDEYPFPERASDLIKRVCSIMPRRISTAA